MSRQNKIILIGKIQSPPEMTTISSGDNKTTFTLEVTRPSQENVAPQSDIISIVVWRDLATTTSTYAQGSTVLVEGSIHNRTFESNDGQRVYVTEVEARVCNLLTQSNEPSQDIPGDIPADIPVIEPTQPNNESTNFDFNEAIQTNEADNTQFAKELGEDVPF